MARSLRRGNGSLSESAKAFWENGLSVLIPRIWTPAARNFS
jgi:hypothetical protein